MIQFRSKMNDTTLPFNVMMSFGRVYTPVCFGNFFDCLSYIWEHEEDSSVDYHLDINPFSF